MSTERKYQLFVRHMFKDEGTIDDDDFGLLHAACGIAGEAGEILDEVKKVIFTDKPFDCKKLEDELGDIEFYLQAIRIELGISRDYVLEKNKKKLEERHGSSFETSNHYKPSFINITEADRPE